MKTQKITVPDCIKTTAQELLSEGGLQVLKVEVESGGEIPIHTHECAATMVITSGRAKTLPDKRIVSKGDVIVKQKLQPHGFTEVTEPFTFISISDGEGILHENQQWDFQPI